MEFIRTYVFKIRIEALFATNGIHIFVKDINSFFLNTVRTYVLILIKSTTL